jgi:hypothetical protein
MKKVNFLMFPIGALGYGLIEILWRGYTHFSMLLAGGLCFVTFAKIGEKFKKQTLLARAVIGSVFVTAIELIFGIFFNIVTSPFFSFSVPHLRKKVNNLSRKTLIKPNKIPHTKVKVGGRYENKA